jgi:hypothetical protein
VRTKTTFRERYHCAGDQFDGLGLLLKGVTGIALYFDPISTGFWHATSGWILSLLDDQTMRHARRPFRYLSCVFLFIDHHLKVQGDIKRAMPRSQTLAVCV